MTCLVDIIFHASLCHIDQANHRSTVPNSHSLHCNLILSDQVHAYMRSSRHVKSILKPYVRAPCSTCSSGTSELKHVQCWPLCCSDLVPRDLDAQAVNGPKFPAS